MSNPYDKPVSTTSSVLGPTLKFKGELTANEDLLIQGQIEGTINHTSSLTVGEEGKVKANVKAEYISVKGKVDGDLSGSKSVVVKEGADVSGNIYSPTVTLREGATFNGSIDMSGKEMPAAKATDTRATNAKASDEKPEPEVETDGKNRSESKKSGAGKKRSASAA